MIIYKQTKNNNEYKIYPTINNCIKFWVYVYQTNAKISLPPKINIQINNTTVQSYDHCCKKAFEFRSISCVMLHLHSYNRLWACKINENCDYKHNISSVYELQMVGRLGGLLVNLQQTHLLQYLHSSGGRRMRHNSSLSINLTILSQMLKTLHCATIATSDHEISRNWKRWNRTWSITHQ